MEASPHARSNVEGFPAVGNCLEFVRFIGLLLYPSENLRWHLLASAEQGRDFRNSAQAQFSQILIAVSDWFSELGRATFFNNMGISDINRVLLSY